MMCLIMTRYLLKITPFRGLLMVRYIARRDARLKFLSQVFPTNGDEVIGCGYRIGAGFAVGTELSKGSRLCVG